MSEANFIPYGRQSIGVDELAAVTAALQGPIITRGAAVEAFEQALSEQVGARYAVAFNSGSAALQACCYAAGVAAGDRVLTTPNSFYITAGSALERGATLVFVDIDRRSGNMDLAQLEQTLNIPNSRGKEVIIPVHFAGIAVDMRHLSRLVQAPDTVIIEDAAHAIGSHYPDGGAVGGCQYSDMTVFSFHPVKTITMGEGGAVTTNREDLWQKLLLFRNNGICRDAALTAERPWHYDVVDTTGNYNVTDMQAALGLAQLRRLDEFASKRRALVKRYRYLLRAHGAIALFDAAHDERSVYHLLVAQIPWQRWGCQRAEVMKRLAAQGIGTQVHYIPIYRHSAMRRVLGDLTPYYPEMEGYYEEALSLPLYYDLTFDDVDRVVATLLGCLGA